MRIYLAGPMRGIENYNYPAFRLGADKLRRLGHDVFSPAEHDEAMGFDANGPVTEEFLMRAIVADLSYILLRAHALYLLPGYEKSKGVELERHAAMFKGIPIVSPLSWYYTEPSVDGADMQRHLELRNQAWDTETRSYRG